MGRSLQRVAMLSILAIIWAARFSAGPPPSGDAPNWVPELSFSYVDRATGERVECGSDCRRFTVPAGIELDIRVQVRNQAGEAATDDSVTWDLWVNQPLHPFPGLDLRDCIDAGTGRTDKACWQALNERVDWQFWNRLNADVSCVPFESGQCRDETVSLIMRPDFEGAHRRGVYHVAVWVDRFRSAVELDEFDNFAGPVRVTVDGGGAADGASRVPPISTPDASQALVVEPSSPQPYGLVVIPEEKETSIALTSHRARGTLEFSPASVGRVSVEVAQSGSYENMVVRIEKISTGKVVAETIGKGHLRLDGIVDSFLLRDDRRFRVVVTPAQGSRGVRATLKVSYPARLRFVPN